MNTYIRDAQRTVEGIKADLISRIQAGSYISEDDWEAYDRARHLVQQQETLWHDDDGLLIDRDHVFGGVA